MFAPYLERWSLVPDGEPVVTRTNHLLPVRYRGEAAMLKLIGHADERRGGTAVLQWWNGHGAARVLAHQDGVLLLERAEGPRSLAAMARSGHDDEACRILCDVAQRLHAPRPQQPPELMSLDAWFAELWPAAETHGGILTRCASMARQLLNAPRDVAVLHGDLHHGNVLDFGPGGWLAIDAMGVVGERGFDYANIFTNPDLDDPTQPVATQPRRFARRLEVVAEAAQIERTRLLAWIIAWTGLSAAWFLGDGDNADIDFTIAALAIAALDG